MSQAKKSRIDEVIEQEIREELGSTRMLLESIRARVKKSYELCERRSRELDRVIYRASAVGSAVSDVLSEFSTLDFEAELGAIGKMLDRRLKMLDDVEDTP